MAMLGKIRRMYFRDGESISEIARRTSLSRNTIKKWLKIGEGVEPRYPKRTRQIKLTPFEPQLYAALETDSHRPKRDRRTIKKLFEELKEQGYTGGYTRVSDLVRVWRLKAGQAVGTGAFVPLHFEYGEAFQFDWSEETLVIGGVWRKIQVAHLKLCASRAFVLVAYPSQGHEMLFDAHMTEIGRRIKEARRQQKLTQSALGAPLGMSRSTISGIETGKIAEVGIRKVMALCACLGLELSVEVKRRYPTLQELRQENLRRR